MNDIRKYWLDKIKSIQNAPPNFLDEVQRRLSNLGIKVAEVSKISMIDFYQRDAMSVFVKGQC